MGTKNLNKIQFHDFIHTYINTSTRIVHTYSIHTEKFYDYKFNIKNAHREQPKEK